MYQLANRWIRKPTPVTTPSMVRDRPSRYRVRLGVKLPTAIHCQSTWMLVPSGRAPVLYWKMIQALDRADSPTEPTPTSAEVFSDQRPREKASSRKPISGNNRVRNSMFIRASHWQHRYPGF